MEFKTIQEAFNYYRSFERGNLEARAVEIREDIDNNPAADVENYNVEIEGIMNVIKDIDDNGERSQSLNPITGQGYNAAAAPKKDVYETQEYRDAFFKQMIGKKLNEGEQRAFNTATKQTKTENREALTSSDAGAVLPTQTLNEVIHEARKQGGLLNEVRSFNMPTGIKIPIGTPTSKAEWHTEGEEVTPDTITTASVKFSGYEIVKVFSLSVKVKAMSISAFESYLIDELAAAVMETIADALVNGTGTEQGTGLDSGITWNKTNKIEGEGEYTDFTKALGLLSRGYGSNAKWAMNNATLYKSIYGMVDANGRPMFMQDARGEEVGRILGKQVIVDDFIEDDTIILGDFSYMAYNMPVGITVESSRESSFRSALIDYRAVAVADTKPLLPEAFVKIVVSEPVTEVEG